MNFNIKKYFIPATLRNRGSIYTQEYDCHMFGLLIQHMHAYIGIKSISVSVTTRPA